MFQIVSFSIKYGSVYFVSGSRRFHCPKVHRERLLENCVNVLQNWKNFRKRVGRWTLVQWGLCWRDIEVLQSYREQIHEKLKCVAQPYKMEVLTEVGWILCWRDREFWLFYRELRWRVVKIVQNAYEMAIPEKNGRFLFEKDQWKNEKWLEMGR